MARPDPRARTQTWAESLALDSLEPLSRATTRSHGAESIHTPIPRSSYTMSRGAPLKPPQLKVSDAIDHSQGPSSGSLRSLLRAATTLEFERPLPESVPSGTSVASVDSLAQLEGANTVAEFQCALPRSTSSLRSTLSPRSHVHASENGQSTVRTSLPVQGAHGFAAKSYWQSIASLVRFLPHLKPIQPSYGRHKNVGRVTCIDYYQDGCRRVAEPLVVDQLTSRRALSQQIDKLKVDKDATLASRLLLVEDLSPDLIAALGHTFQIDPEFFAEHLNRSGYDGVDYDDVLPTNWNTSDLPKPHVSMSWFRPVDQNPWVTEWLKDPSLLLDKREVLDDETTKVELSAITWNDPTHDSTGHADKYAMAHKAVVDTNIFRRSWTLTARPLDRDMAAQPIGPGTKLSEADWSLVPTAWEERVSFYRCKSGGVPLDILLLDPLPAITDLQVRQHRKKSRVGGSSVRSQPLCQPIDMALPMAPRLSPSIVPNKYMATDQQVKALEEAFSTLRTTTDVLVSDKRMINVRTPSTPHADPILALLRVMESDTRLFLRTLEWTLDEISQDSLDDFLMTRRLSEWRKLMSNFEIQVPAIGRGLENFITFIFRGDESHELPEEVSDLVKSFNEDIVRVKTRLNDAYTNLRADMQFTESRRSINEAKTVNRLTELAFIFIPLSFCASLFSMSIRELGEGVPVWTFVVTALGMLIFAYTARFFISSEFLLNSTRRSLERFWRRKGVRRGDDAPVLIIIRFTAEELWNSGGSDLFWRFAGIVTLMAFPVIPVALMWKSTGMGAGFNSAVTLLLLLPVLAVGVVRLFVSGSGYSSRWVNRQGGASETDSDEEV